MRFNVEVEKPTSILRKLKIRVPADEVQTHFQRGLVQVQKTANIKGFRPGNAPISMIRQYYGEDVRHRVFHTLIDDSFDRAVRQEELKVVGSPKIDSSTHQTGQGAHDHGIQDQQDLVYTATVEVLPEIELQDYQGVALNQEKIKVTDEMVEDVIQNLRNSQAQLAPVSGGLALADGTTSSRPAVSGDFVDTAFAGGLVTETGVEAREDMKGSRLIEIGSHSMIEGFEDQLIGMRTGETKTFRIHFPADYGGVSGPQEARALAGKEAEFTVTAQDIKEKKLPELDDEFVKTMGYESVDDLRKRAADYLLNERTQESLGKLQAALVSHLVQKHAFDVPSALVDGQTRALLEEWAQDMKKEGHPENSIQETLKGSIAAMRKRAESQVRASLILESIANAEKITVTQDQIREEMSRLAKSMNSTSEQLEEFYAKNPGRMGDLEFRLRQELTVKFLLDKANITSVEASEK